MNQEKIGNFLKKLREEKGWTQEELADKLNVVREAISRWERGKGIPEITSLDNLSKIYNVSIEEILSGECNPKENITLKLYENQNKLKKKLTICILVVLLLIIMFLGYYFISQFRQVKIYDIFAESKNFRITNDVMIKTNDRIVLNINHIENNNNLKIDKLELFYKDNNEEKLILRTTNEIINITDYIDSSEYFEWNNFEQIINNMYIKMYYNNTSETLKLTFQRSYINNNFFLKKKQQSYIDEPLNPTTFELSEETKILEEKIINSFIKEDDSYKFEFKEGKDRIFFSYDYEIKELYLLHKNEEFVYYLTDNSLYYNNYEENEVQFQFKYDGKYTCIRETCVSEEKMKEKTKYFKNILETAINYKKE